MDYKEAVAKGIAVLDKHRPGWRDQIDWSKLDLGSMDYCVLGQLHPSRPTEDEPYLNRYVAMRTTLIDDETGRDPNPIVTRADYEWAIEHGFDTPLIGHSASEVLGEEWRRAVTIHLDRGPRDTTTALCGADTGQVQPDRAVATCDVCCARHDRDEEDGE